MAILLRTGYKNWRTDLIDAVQIIHEYRQQWWQHSSREHRIIFLLMICVAVGMRLQFIHQPIRTDEAVTFLQYASGNILQPLYDYSAPNNHILHTLGVSLTTRLLGNAEWSIRLTTFVSGILLVISAYIMNAILFNRRSALLVAGFIAVSAPLIEYSTNARGYMLQANFLMACIIFASLTQSSKNRIFWLGFVISSALGFYTIPTMLYGFTGIMLWWGLSALRQPNIYKALRWWFIAGFAVVILTLILYLPVFIVSGIGAITNNTYVQAQNFSTLMQLWGMMLVDIQEQWFTDIPIWIQIIFVMGFVKSVLIEWEKRFPLVLCIIIAITMLLIMQRVAPFTRVFLPLLPIFLAYAGNGLHALAEHVSKLKGHSVIVGLSLIFVGIQISVVTQTKSPYTSLETGTMRDAESIIIDMGDKLANNTRIIYQHPSGESLLYYAYRYGINPQYILRDYSKHERLWVVINHEYKQTQESVFQHNTLVIGDYQPTQHRREYPNATVYEYVRTP